MQRKSDYLLRCLSYLFSASPEVPLKPLRNLVRTKLSGRFAGRNAIEAKNSGKYAAIAVRLYNSDHKWELSHRNNHGILFPGEKVRIPFRAFERIDPSHPGMKAVKKPDLWLDAINSPANHLPQR